MTPTIDDQIRSQLCLYCWSDDPDENGNCLNRDECDDYQRELRYHARDVARSER